MEILIPYQRGGASYSVVCVPNRYYKIVPDKANYEVGETVRLTFVSFTEEKKNICYINEVKYTLSNLDSNDNYYIDVPMVEGGLVVKYKYQITVVSDAYGTVECEDATDGGLITIKCIPNTGESLLDIKIDGTSVFVSGQTTYTYFVTYDVTVKVYFMYTLNIALSTVESSDSSSWGDTTTYFKIGNVKPTLTLSYAPSSVSIKSFSINSGQVSFYRSIHSYSSSRRSASYNIGTIYTAAITLKNSYIFSYDINVEDDYSDGSYIVTEYYIGNNIKQSSTAWTWGTNVLTITMAGNVVLSTGNTYSFNFTEDIKYTSGFQKLSLNISDITLS